jgi:hypothetical protein
VRLTDLGQFSAKVRVAEVARDWPNRHLGPEGQRWEGLRTWSSLRRSPIRGDRLRQRLGARISQALPARQLEGLARERIAELARSVDGTGASAERVQARMGTERDELRRERGALRERIGTLDTDIRAPEFARGCLIQRGIWKTSRRPDWSPGRVRW